MDRMAAILPEPGEFETPVYGTVFAERSSALGCLQVGEALILVPDTQTSFSERPTFTMARMASSRSSRVCAADTWQRMRA